MPARRFIIRGIVQGVGYRFAMCQQATRLGITGWVRNRRDGNVEALAVGDAHALDALQRWAAQGPPGARVDAVEATHLSKDDSTVEAGTGFTQIPTV